MLNIVVGALLGAPSPLDMTAMAMDGGDLDEGAVEVMKQIIAKTIHDETDTLVLAALARSKDTIKLSSWVHGISDGIQTVLNQMSPETKRMYVIDLGLIEGDDGG